MTTGVEEEALSRWSSNTELISALREEEDEDARSSWSLDIINDPERGRWIALLGPDAIGELTYRFAGGRVVMLSTWVGHGYRNHHVAAELIKHALDEIRASGKKITIVCPVVGEFIVRHPVYRDLIDGVHPGSGAFPPAESTPSSGSHLMPEPPHRLADSE